MIIAVTLLKWPRSLQEHNDLYLMDSSRSELGVIFVRALLNCAPDYQQTAREGVGGGGLLLVGKVTGAGTIILIIILISNIIVS